MQNPAFADPASLGVGTDWLGAFFQTAPMQNYSFNYSGGSDKSSLYVSGNYFSQDGIIIGTGYNKFTFQLNSDNKISSILKFGNSLTLNYDLKSNGDYSVSNAMLALPTQTIYTDDGTYSKPEGLPIYSGDITNPIGNAKVIKNSTDGYNLMGNIYGELEILKGLKFKTTFGIQANFWNSRNWAPKRTWDYSGSLQSSLSEQYNKNLTWLWDNTFTYDKTVGKHKFNVMGGTSAQENRYNFMNGSIQGFANDNINQIRNGLSLPTIDGSTSSWSIFSYLGRVNYSFADKYLITASLRHDGSSRFGENRKYGLFPSASLAWRISEEDFFKKIHFIDNMKIRAGYGETGNQNIGNYSFASQLNTIKYNFNNTLVSAVSPVVMPNPFVQWESQKQGNIGFDASVLNQRVDITLDAYLKQTDNMLVPMSVPVSTGYSDIFVPSINAGKMENRGIELTINTKNITGKFSWNTTFNVSYNTNKVMSINDTVPMPVGSLGLNKNLALLKAGLPINEFYGFVTDGIFQNQQEVNNHATQVSGIDPTISTAPGDIRFKDLNNDGVIDDKDRTYLGNPNPSFTFAMNNTFAYMGFDLSIFLQGVAGNKILNANRFWNEAMEIPQNQTIATLGRWNGEGTSNTMPRAIYNNPNKNSRPSDRYIEDGSYLRIKNLTIGYSLPKSWLKKSHLSTARCYMTGQNLLTFTKYSGFDPEIGINGIDNNVYPVTRTFSVGINLGM
jgi:TonB-linked SusC/RagA family outer membrane protein